MLVLLFTTPALGAKEIMVGPFYNPHTKSYFAYVDMNIMGGAAWRGVRKAAARKTYHGVPGRLAVVKDRQTHDWLREKFGDVIDKETWIGLRYFCGARKLMWVDGTIMDRSPPGLWHPQWHRTWIMCGRVRMEYMPVYYVGGGMQMVWQASGIDKFQISYLVEFPTGKP
ncbi:C-type lectin domain-containing protein [Caenispirillum salinarum]|uniref:C-type lectin domain-containing protein n=1 Tax=Caenispirillum salinarum TaxID=859058 RepID=UPI00384BECDF